jgi:hypothetical protein
MKPSLIYVAVHSLVFVTAVAQAAEPDASKPKELQVLDRLVGKWDSESVSRVAEWTPKEGHAKGVLTREWVLNGRYVQEISKQSDADAIVMFTYDASKKAYRWWLFNSQGTNIETSGKWDEASQILSFSANLDGGLVNSSTIKFIDGDTHQWKATVKDGQGKVYYDGEGTCKRQK